jgi:hypothetical protein
MGSNTRTMAPRFRLLPILALPTFALALVLALTCATTSPNPNAAKYPPRPGGCKVRVFHTPAPDVKEWDDLGMAHVDCPLDVGAVQCLKRLRMEACRMGGDIVYDVPKKPARPTEQGMVYAGHVAHTKERSDDAGKGNDKDSDDGGAGEVDQPEGQSAGTVEPVEPISPSAPTVPLVPFSPISHGEVGARHPVDGGQ